MKEFQFDASQIVRPQENDNRKPPRINQNLLVQVREGDRLRDAITADFSLSGMQLRLPLPLEAQLNKPLQLLLQLPHDSKEDYIKQDPVELTGKVLWSRDTANGHLYGLTFLSPSAEQQEMLKRCFEYYSHSPTFH
ncbi:PilZ domain-containing protein [Chromobacterium paludis]|uniref:PilZ domain-containing protein n=2 Tax=Chromobacterium paludis TaxID=2605945 RepID=A0A5C1DNW5_9NEIS|nr:PilZ domain-containing protein [Chromobacterium paludis]